MSSHPQIPAIDEAAQIRTAGHLDKIAVALSGICVLHCLLAPLAFTLLPILSLNTWWEDVLFHQMMLWLVLPTSTIALFIGCRKHRDLLILGSGVLGMLLLIAVATAGHEVLSLNAEKLITSIAGIILAISHILNFRACQKITCNDRNCETRHHH